MRTDGTPARKARSAKNAMNNYLCRSFAIFSVLAASQLYAKDHLLTDEQIRQDVKQLLALELAGLYDITSITILPRDSNQYGDQTVRIRFQSIKNAQRLARARLNTIEDRCGVPYFYLLCRPKGHRFSGDLTLQYFYTNKGMAHRVPLQLKSYPLVQFLDVKESQKGGYVLPP